MIGTGISMTLLWGFVGAVVFFTAEGQAADEVATKDNLLRNGGFELGEQFNGALMRQGTEFIRTHMALSGTCHHLPTEGWWIEGASTDRVSLEQKEVHSGSRSLVIAPPAGKQVSVFSAPEMPVSAGPVTLSAWVRTTGAKGTLAIDFIAGGAKPSDIPRFLSRTLIALPEMAGPWTRVQLTAAAPANAAAGARITVEAGRVAVDDLKLEAGSTPTAFDVRGDERLSLAFEGVPETRLPCWREKDPATQTLQIRNASNATIKGNLEIWIGPWSKPKTEKAAVLNDLELKAGDIKTIPLHLDHLKPDAYVLVSVLSRDGAVLLDGERTVDASTTIGGAHSNSMLRSRAAIRFAIAPNVEPAKIFGVGNSMLEYGWKGCEGCWSPGWPLSLFAVGDEGFVCGRSSGGQDDQFYLFAAAGLSVHRNESPGLFSGTPKGASFEVPGKPGSIDIWNPEGMALLKANAVKAGKANAENPLVASYQMQNECFFAARDGLCATAAADAHFRNWCRQRHGDLATLNRCWGVAYQSWDEVEQPASVRYIDEVKKRPKRQGAAALDWTAALGDITPDIQQRMMAVPGRAMDWYRWRTWSSLWAYNTFHETARQYDRKTLYSTNLPWPDYWPQMCMPFFRSMDVTMLDCQYTSGLPRGLGTPTEMMEILEMAESNAPDKPVWGIETYIQPQWPAGFASLQNWGMVAHGMTNNLIFAWGPYSDSGVPKETRAWEKPNAVPMWMLIDLDGKKLPAYFTNQRSLQEIQKFHKTFDALSLRRIPSNVALFVSRDTAEYSSLESANKPWVSLWARTRNTLCYLLRLSGITADFVDDQTMPTTPGQFTTIIVPASYVLSQETAVKLATFAREGGTVILAGPSGIVDPWLNKYANLGGPAWADLGWIAPAFKLETAPADFLDGKASAAESKMFKGGQIGEMASARPIHDSRGAVVGWKRPWGKGNLVAYRLAPDSYTGNPHPSQNLLAWTRQLISAGQLHYTGRWNSPAIRNSGTKHGEGAPVVDVVIRAGKGKEAEEKFVFVLNQGGAGEGTVEIPVAEGDWQAHDALTGAVLAGAAVTNGVWQWKITCKPWDYKILHLTRKRG
jgi:hypothetical protein